MSNQEILEKAIQKAIDSGYKHSLIPEWTVEDIVRHGEYDIFNHDFAKALWGESRGYVRIPVVMGFKGNNLGQTYQFHEPAWQYHLQNMVIAEDPIKYLGENL